MLLWVSVWVTGGPGGSGTVVPVWVHLGSDPPPGSHPMTRTFPSQVNAAECQRPLPWVRSPTPSSVIVYRSSGSSRLPPGVALAPMSHTLTVSALAQAARLTLPRITPASWHPVRTFACGPASGSLRSRVAFWGASSGIWMMSMKAPTGSSLARVASTHPALLELLLLTLRLGPETPASVRVWEPHASGRNVRTEGSALFVMSNTWTPSTPAGTMVPSQSRAVVFFEFHARTRMFSHTTMSPWSPLQ